MVGYAEVHCKSNFSFLRGASHPDELVDRAAELGYQALAITDRNTLAGVVRMHVAAKLAGLKVLIGAEMTPSDALPIALYATDRAAYGRLARLITRGRLRRPKGECDVRFDDIAELADGLIGVVFPASVPQPSPGARDGAPSLAHVDAIGAYREIFADRLYVAAEVHAGQDDDGYLAMVAGLCRRAGVPMVAANDVHYHEPKRRFLQDVVACVRERCTITEAGARLFANGERYLKSAEQMARLFYAYPQAIARTVEIADRCTFSLDELRYEYPEALCPAGRTAIQYLTELAWHGARDRFPDGLPEKVPALIVHELQLIEELNYEPYFLTVWDIVRFARSRGILCQGRGSAANSAVCYCIGVTNVDPARIDLLFERFVSKERNEPPDIDVDFEHERREEVFQYIYEKYGREHAGIVAEVITYRPRSAVRDVGKALGLSLDRVDLLAKKLEWWGKSPLPEDRIAEAGLDPNDRTIRLLTGLLTQIVGFPRHLSQHVGGFVITRHPLCEMVPIGNGAMPDRTFIEWDKNDIDVLGILKVDCLALGMMTALQKAFGLISRTAQSGQNRARQEAASRACGVCEGLRPLLDSRGSVSASTSPLCLRASMPSSLPPSVPPCLCASFVLPPRSPSPSCLTDIPAEDPVVYDMICKADTVGVFQIESRAQMSMLPRLRPRSFYDLVIEVAIVRPGPIQGGMVHPYLRRRNGEEEATYPNAEIAAVLLRDISDGPLCSGANRPCNGDSDCPAGETCLPAGAQDDHQKTCSISGGDCNIDDDCPTDETCVVECVTDSLDLGVDEIFEIVRIDQPITPVGFVNAFRSRFPQHAVGLWKTATNVAAEYTWPDLDPPGAVSTLSSPTHPIGVGGSWPLISLTWDAAPDDASGADTYATAWSDAPLGVPVYEETVTGRDPVTGRFSTTSPPMTLGEWWFMIRAQDCVGTWSSAVAWFGPFEVTDCNANGDVDVCETSCLAMKTCSTSGASCASSSDCLTGETCDAVFCNVAGCGSLPDCNNNGAPDACDISEEVDSDCNYNGIPDACDTSVDFAAWVTPFDGFWHEPTNWEGGALPGIDDYACIQVAGADITVEHSAGHYDIGGLGSHEHLVQSGGSLTMANASVIYNDLDFLAGIFDGAGDLDVWGAIDWGGGTMSGSGTIRALNGFTLSGSATKTLTGNQVLSILGGTWLDGNFQISASGEFNNFGVFDIAAVDRSIPWLSGSPVFNNRSGSAVNKLVGTGTTSVSAAYNNMGTTNIQGGALLLGGRGTCSGQFVAGGGAVLQITSDYDLTSNSSIDVESVFLVSGSINVNGDYDVSEHTRLSGLVHFNPDAVVTNMGNLLEVLGGTADLRSGSPINIESYRQTSGTRNGTDTITASGVSTWTYGYLGGWTANSLTPTLNADGGLVLSGANVKTLTNSHVLNSTDTTWSDGILKLSQSAEFNSSGSFSIQPCPVLGEDCDNPFEGAIVRWNGGDPQFNNDGILTVHTGIQTATFGTTLNNNGLVSVLDGRFRATGGGTSGGVFSAAPSTILEFGWNHTLTDTSTLSAETVEFTNGSIDVSGEYNVADLTHIAANVSFRPEANLVSTGSTLNIVGGSVGFSSGEDVGVTTYTQSGGTVDGSDHIAVSGQTTWSGGMMGGSTVDQTTPVTDTNGVLLLEGTNTKVLGDDRILNAVDTTWNSGVFQLRNNAVFNNLDSFIVSAIDGTIQWNGGTPVFNNTAGALFTKSPATGTTICGVEFRNDGAVDVQDGTLNLSAGGTHTGLFGGAGTLHLGFGVQNFLPDSIVTPYEVINSGATTNVEGTYDVPVTNISGGTVDYQSPGAIGDLTFSAGTLGGEGTVTVSGLTTWSGGGMTGAGITNADGDLLLDAPATKVLRGARTLNSNATTTWREGILQLQSDARFNNHAAFNVQLSDGVIQWNGGDPQFNNMPGATLTKLPGSGTTTVGVAFINDGVVTVQEGLLRLASGVNRGTLAGLPGATIDFYGGTHELADVSSVSATSVLFSGGTVQVDGGYTVGTTEIGAATVEFNGEADTDTLILSAGASVLGGTGSLSVGAQATWSAGTMLGNGVTRVEGDLAIEGTSAKAIRGNRVVDSFGTTTWDGGIVQCTENAVFNNHGTFEIELDGGSLQWNGGSAQFHNRGGATLTKRPGSGDTTIGFAFNNAGLVDILDGDLRFTGAAGAGYTQTDGVLLLNGGNVESTSQPLSFMGGVLTGIGTVSGHVVNAADVAPGLPIGATQVAGNYTQTDSGVLTIDVGDAAGCGEFDQLQIAGHAALEGALRIELNAGCVPFGQAFTIMTYGSRSGAFNSVEGPCAGIEYDLNYEADRLTLTVTQQVGVAGDLNFDTSVDLIDFAVFQDCFSDDSGAIEPCCEVADLNDDGTINLTDYAMFHSIVTGS